MIKGKNFLTAAFLDGSVTVCGSTFPAGQFSVFLLNRYYPVFGVAVATPIAEVLSVLLSLIFIAAFFKKLKKEPENR